MRRIWTLVLILSLMAAIGSWLYLPPSSAAAVMLVAAFAAFVSLQFLRRP